jgi:hypothetical protein
VLNVLDYGGTSYYQILKKENKMIRLLLGLLISLNGMVYAMEGPEREGEVHHPLKSYLPLPPDSLETIYNSKKESHKLAICRKKDMPLCLQSEEGPFPFYGYALDPQLCDLVTQYFAALKFDDKHIQDETLAIRNEAEEIQRTDLDEALKLLYRAGWKMGDPLAAQSLIPLLKAGHEEIFLPKGSNLISVLRSYPKTQKEIVQIITMSRASIDYKRSLSGSFDEMSMEDPRDAGFDEEEGEEKSFLLPDTSASSHVRQRKK